MPRPAGHRLNRSAWEDVLSFRGLTLTQVADMAEVARPTISALLGQHNAASVTTAHRIAAALDVQPATLFPTISPAMAGAKS